MFEWLVGEMDRIKTNKFHLVDGPASAEFREVVESSNFPVPPSYKEFVLRFGNARLYRRGSGYLVEVFAGPREAQSEKGEPLLHVGRTNTTLTSLVYFKEPLLVAGGESPVFEWRHNQGLRRSGDGFESWLKAKCASARKRFNKGEWKAVEEGPPPFTEREKAVVEARKHFSWRVAGVAANEDVRFEIHNGSRMILPYLSIGIRGRLRPPKNGPLTGGAYLPTAHIGPGETKIVEHACYKKFVAPEDVEAFEKPEPGPEDREQYWEFKEVRG